MELENGNGNWKHKRKVPITGTLSKLVGFKCITVCIYAQTSPSMMHFAVHTHFLSILISKLYPKYKKYGSSVMAEK